MGAKKASAEEGEDEAPPPVKLVDDEAMAPTIDSIFVFSVIWAVGGCTNAKGRVVFDKLFREVLAGGVPDDDLALFIPKEHLSLVSTPVPDTDGGVWCTSVDPSVDPSLAFELKRRRPIFKYPVK